MSQEIQEIQEQETKSVLSATESTATATKKTQKEPAPKGKGEKHKLQIKIYVGRRKTSIARVRLTSGDGEFVVNRKPIQNYFPLLNLQQRAKDPLVLLEQEKKYNTFVNVKGGGIRGQAEAISLAIARALSDNDPASQKKLRVKGLLTRDPRMVERKKYGLHKARRAPQFSKR